MRSRLDYITGGLFLLLLGIFAGCANPPVIGNSIAEMTWGDTFIRSFIRDSFIGYTVPMLLAVVGIFVKLRWLRYVILAYAIIYLGFVLNLTIDGLGLPSTLILFSFRDGGIKQYFYLFLLLAIMVLIGFVVGRSFCGWVCPMGGIQQFFFRKGFGIKVNWKAHNWLRWLRYALLLAIIATTVIWRVTWWGPNDPFRNFYRQEFTIIGVVLMVLVLAGTLFVMAPWCRYVCPLGALLALFSKLSFFKVRIDQEKCTSCGHCWREDCNYQAITPGGKELKPKVNQLECTSCQECVNKCPAKAMSFSGPGHKSAPPEAKAE